MNHDQVEELTKGGHEGAAEKFSSACFELLKKFKAFVPLGTQLVYENFNHESFITAAFPRYIDSKCRLSVVRQESNQI